MKHKIKIDSDGRYIVSTDNLETTFHNMETAATQISILHGIIHDLKRDNIVCRRIAVRLTTGDDKAVIYNNDFLVSEGDIITIQLINKE